MRIRDFFYVRRSDREVIVVLLLVIVVALGLLFVTGGEETSTMTTDVDSTTVVSPEHDSVTRARIYYKVEEQKHELFAFDPNTADSSQLLRLGLQPWQVRNVYKYRAAGGVYREKRDFARLYGLTVKKYRELEPYIRISNDYAPASTLFDSVPRRVGAHEKETGDENRAQRYPQKLSEGETIELNTADTTALRKVPGIGSYYARRIVQYRERLGGFVSQEQLSEVEGLSQESQMYFTVTKEQVRKLNINSLTLDQLKRHPYINYYQARAITDYRRQHGRINDLSDLQLLRDFPTETIERLRPYVTY